jgi:hypothetical protein
LTYGSQAEISKDKVLYAYLRSKMHRKTFKNDKRYLLLKKYSSEITIKISTEDFYRHGWDFSLTDIVDINRMLEQKAKALLYKTVGIRCSFGNSLSESIALFQKEYEFTEDIWSFDSIYKDCQRNLKVFKGEMNELVSKYINNVKIN